MTALLLLLRASIHLELSVNSESVNSESVNSQSVPNKPRGAAKVDAAKVDGAAKVEGAPPLKREASGAPPGVLRLPLVCGPAEEEEDGGGEVVDADQLEGGAGGLGATNCAAAKVPPSLVWDLGFRICPSSPSSSLVWDLGFRCPRNSIPETRCWCEGGRGLFSSYTSILGDI